jgi:hypothetical protein
MTVPPVRVSADWTTRSDVVRMLRQRYDKGEFLSRFAAGAGWEPLAIRLKGPTARDISNDFAAAQDWARGWHTSAGATLRIEHATVGGRIVGTNQVPRLVWIDSYQQLWTLLGVSKQVQCLTDLLAVARCHAPRLVSWMIRHLMRVLALAQDWPKIMRTVTWIDENQRPQMYLRQVDVPGVDTKFIERHRAVLSDLLDCQLDPQRVNSSFPRTDLLGRFGFRDKPQYIRFRILGATTGQFGIFSELSVRAAELASVAPPLSTVYVVENEITYLAFPSIDDAIVIYGGGYALTTLHQLRWLEERNIVYWGDIDTHGFSMLDRLRGRFPHVRSMLMDRATLLAHESQWVREERPINVGLERLTPDEANLYRDLVEDTIGPSLRLEQERVRFSSILKACGLTAQ